MIEALKKPKVQVQKELGKKKLLAQFSKLKPAEKKQAELGFAKKSLNLFKDLFKQQDLIKEYFLKSQAGGSKYDKKFEAAQRKFNELRSKVDETKILKGLYGQFNFDFKDNRDDFLAGLKSHKGTKEDQYFLDVLKSLGENNSLRRDFLKMAIITDYNKEIDNINEELGAFESLRVDTAKKISQKDLKNIQKKEKKALKERNKRLKAKEKAEIKRIKSDLADPEKYAEELASADAYWLATAKTLPDKKLRLQPVTSEELAESFQGWKLSDPKKNKKVGFWSDVESPAEVLRDKITNEQAGRPAKEVISRKKMFDVFDSNLELNKKSIDKLVEKEVDIFDKDFVLVSHDDKFIIVTRNEFERVGDYKEILKDYQAIYNDKLAKYKKSDTAVNLKKANLSFLQLEGFKKWYGQATNELIDELVILRGYKDEEKEDEELMKDYEEMKKQTRKREYVDEWEKTAGLLPDKYQNKKMTAKEKAKAFEDWKLSSGEDIDEKSEYKKMKKKMKGKEYVDGWEESAKQLPDRELKPDMFNLRKKLDLFVAKKFIKEIVKDFKVIKKRNSLGYDAEGRNLVFTGKNINKELDAYTLIKEYEGSQNDLIKQEIKVKKTGSQREVALVQRELAAVTVRKLALRKYLAEFKKSELTTPEGLINKAKRDYKVDLTDDKAVRAKLNNLKGKMPDVAELSNLWKSLQEMKPVKKKEKKNTKGFFSRLFGRK